MHIKELMQAKDYIERAMLFLGKDSVEYGMAENLRDRIKFDIMNMQVNHER